MEQEKATIIDRIEEVLISVLLGAATVLVFAQVVARYLFNKGITWAPELVQHFFLWTVMIGASYGFKHGVHLGVDVLMKKLPQARRRMMALLAVVVSLGFTGYMAYLSFYYVLGSYRMNLITVDLQIPQWIPHLALPLGFFMISIRLAQVFWWIHIGRMINVSTSGELDNDEIEDITKEYYPPGHPTTEEDHQEKISKQEA
ncbi:MAG: TRAP transporter small permease [Proteobacteria bacterium]|nr:TRAP transporter small permease [Pseudomonadota bacterium]MBU1739538.1 TRAP transporter small permease [Pseudomonadota bacterium]